jgi:competence protein ComEC
MFRIHILDVGRGDSIIMQFSNGRTYLIDSNEISGKVRPFEYLTKTLGVTELEAVIATHPHTDHVLGLQNIIENVPTRQVWLSDYLFPGRVYRNFQLAIQRNPNIRILYPCSGTTVVEGKDKIQVLAPPPSLLKRTHCDANNASIVLKVTITNEKQRTSTSTLLGADAQLDSWAYILAEHREKMQADFR